MNFEEIESFYKIATSFPTLISNAKSEGVDLSEIEDFSYSAVLRQLRKQLSDKEVLEFLKLFKKHFDSAIKKDIQQPDQIALQKALEDLSENISIEFSQDLVKEAFLTELGEPELVGKYLSNIIKFTLNKIDSKNRQKAMNKVKQKIFNLDSNDIAAKKMPPSSSMGQSITFVKHVLFNHDANYVRKVINSIVKYL